MKASPNANIDAGTLNHALVDELKRKGYLNTPQVEAAFRSTPRHVFVPDVPLEEAYSDRAIVAKKDQQDKWISSSSQPAIMAIMLEQLGLKPGHRVLEIGAGTGYNAALMAHLVGETGQVVTLDIEEELTKKASERLATLGLDQVLVICADGGHGYPGTAPYDRVILTVRPPDILPAWTGQTKVGGRIVLPLEIKRDQLSIAFEKIDGHLVSRSAKPCGFMTLRGAFAVTPANWLQLGPDTGLSLDVVGTHPVNADEIYSWLTGTSKDWESDIKVTAREIQCGLGLWLMLHESEMCILVAQDDMIERNIVPTLIEFGGERKSVFTGLLSGDEGLAALMRPPGKSVPAADCYDPYDSDSSFKLFVRQFGPEESLAHRLLKHIKVWDEAGRPAIEGLRIRAYPKDANYTASIGEFVIEKQWTQLVLDWPTG